MAAEPSPQSDALQRLERLGGNEFVTRVIGLFLSEVPARVAAARAALEARDAPGLAFAAHSLVSSAGNLGAVDLQEVVREIERRTPERQWEELAHLVRRLEETADSALLRLAAERDRREGA